MKVFSICFESIENIFGYLKKIKDVLFGLDDEEILKIMDKMRDKEISYFRRGSLEIKLLDKNNV